MLITKVVAFAYLYVYKAPQNRRCYGYKEIWALCVQPMNIQRGLKTAFESLNIGLREDERKFFNYFWMCHKTFDKLLAKI